MKTSMQQLHPHRWLVSAALLVCSLSYLVSGCPPDRDPPEPPKSLAVVAHGNRTFELLWKSTDPSRDSDDYLFVIIWCTYHPRIPKFCMPFGTAYQPGNDTRVTLELPEYAYSQATNFNFSITATSCSGASAAVWLSCEVQRNSTNLMSEMKVTVKNVTSRSIEVGWPWAMDCLDLAIADIVLGYEISYCPIDFKPNVFDPRVIYELERLFGPGHFACQQPPELVTVTGGNVTTLTINDLEPYTTYKLAVRVVGVDGEKGKFSTPQFTATLAEEEPSVLLSTTVETD